MGGARSGKSSFAELIAEKLAGDEVIYLASGQAIDSEMEARIEAHKKQRPETWQTIEEAFEVSKRLSQIPEGSTVLFDCLTTYLSNLLLKHEGEEYEQIESKLLAEVEALLKISLERELELIIVHNQVGQGIVPSYKLGRYFRDISGRAARLCAAEAELVYSVTAGLPQEIKQEGLEIIEKYQKADGEVRVL